MNGDRKRRVVAVNEKGIRIGEGHQHAKLSDADVELMREMYEEGFVSYSELARRFEISKSAVRDIVRYRRRAQTAMGFKEI